uniref:Uncharacterized protein n=1 Tax=Romanomermis culicivorax TaxID=13658 RepID=A0A915IKH1_ROMCU
MISGSGQAISNTLSGAGRGIEHVIEGTTQSPTNRSKFSALGTPEPFIIFASIGVLFFCRMYITGATDGSNQFSKSMKIEEYTGVKCRLMPWYCLFHASNSIPVCFVAPGQFADEHFGDHVKPTP